MRDVINSPWMFWAASALLGAGGITAHVAGDALLRAFAAREPDLWRQAGMPSHLFGGSLFSLESRGVSSVTWLVKAPQWIGGHPGALGLLSLARIGALLMAGGLVMIGVVLVSR